MLPKLFLLDAMALIYRAYYAMIKSPRITSTGLNTSAILGFTNTLYEIIKNEKPSHIAVAFDTGAPTLRHADFAAYKANREATPEDIITSIPYIKQVIEAFGIPIISKDGYEADDIIGTLAKKAEIEGFQVFMMTSDKDYGQLVSEHILMFKPAKFGQPAEVVGPEEICEKYSIQRPEQLIDILGLWGDASDNIPGVPGIGEVKAKKLIAQFGSIENIYQKIEEVDNAKLKQTLVDNQEQALVSKVLATIMLDVPIEYHFKEMKYEGPHPEKLRSIFNELEFRSLEKRIFTDLSLQDKPIQPAIPDLFSAPFELEQQSTISSEPIFKCYHQTNHHIIKIEFPDELPFSPINSTLFFDWIFIDAKIAGFAFANGDETVYYHLLENEHYHYKKLLKEIFENESTVVTYQCKPTYKFFKSLKINNKTTLFDLQIAHYLIQPENSHNLDRLTENYLGYQLMNNTSNFEIHTCERIEIFKQLHLIFKQELETSDMLSLFNHLEMPLAEVLADMEYTGITLDKYVLQENSIQLNQDINTLESQIYELAGQTFNIASPKQLGEILFNKLEIIENAKLTKTKQYQTGEEILNKLINKHPIIPLILEWRTLSKLKSTYIDALPALVNEMTGKIHTTFNQTVTSTGRLSSVNPNLQNIPIRTERGKDVRKAFVASDENRVILSADYSQIELRVVAAVCGDERMIETFNQHQDIHTTMAAHIYKVSHADVTSYMRRNAKTVNFGILYGISAFGLAERLHIPQKEARELITEYYHSFPKITEYLNNTIEFARKNGYVETLLGRRRYIQDINSSNAILRKAAERNAINAPIQGTAADLIKIAMIRIWHEIKNRKLQSKMLLQVHDELIFEIPKNEIEEMEIIIHDLMSHAMTFSVPLDVEMNYGKSWYEAH